ncbi:hypothetical protein DPEC_G00102630 [Dallia pectoralis]|uniref:Uncharacterized protein n=1 Tax=Dallia pectoralis TaxID=75939 RepID=A0ACC2GY33_DALPE|nr:hypothetical protein DPEC_G00102630 [Dallia pectoralis]
MSVRTTILVLLASLQLLTTAGEDLQTPSTQATTTTISNITPTESKSNENFQSHSTQATTTTISNITPTDSKSNENFQSHSTQATTTTISNITPTESKSNDSSSNTSETSPAVSDNANITSTMKPVTTAPVAPNKDLNTSITTGTTPMNRSTVQPSPSNERPLDTNIKEDKDSNWMWISLGSVGLAGLAGVAGIKIFRNRSTIHDHTDVTDNGTENASFQSRPESSKDGVQLIGVKSSDENAAAR